MGLPMLSFWHILYHTCHRNECMHTQLYIHQFQIKKFIPWQKKWYITLMSQPAALWSACWYVPVGHNGEVLIPVLTCPYITVLISCPPVLPLSAITTRWSYEDRQVIKSRSYPPWVRQDRTQMTSGKHLYLRSQGGLIWKRKVHSNQTKLVIH